MPLLPRTRRRPLYVAVLAGLTAMLCLLAAPHAHAATTPVYSGTGWKIATQDGIHSLSPKPYTITFTDTASRTRLTPYATAVAAQLTSVTGTVFTVTTTIEAPPAVGSCPAEHHLIVGVKYRPTGVKGTSHAWNCFTNRPGSVDYHAAWGGWAWIDSEYWSTSSWFSSSSTVNTAKVKNAITHEIGHIVGLTHPNKDLDKDGVVENYECAKTTYGYLPVMCAPSGGYTTASGGGQFTSRDTPGLKQLVANYGLG